MVMMVGARWRAQPILRFAVRPVHDVDFPSVCKDFQVPVDSREPDGQTLAAQFAVQILRRPEAVGAAQDVVDRLALAGDPNPPAGEPARGLRLLGAHG